MERTIVIRRYTKDKKKTLACFTTCDMANKVSKFAKKHKISKSHVLYLALEKFFEEIERGSNC